MTIPIRGTVCCDSDIGIDSSWIAEFHMDDGFYDVAVRDRLSGGNYVPPLVGGMLRILSLRLYFFCTSVHNNIHFYVFFL